MLNWNTVQSSTNSSSHIRKMPRCCLDLRNCDCHISYVHASVNLESGKYNPTSLHCYFVTLQCCLDFRFSAGLTVVIPVSSIAFLHQLLTDDRATVRQALMPRNPGPVGGGVRNNTQGVNVYPVAILESGNPKLRYLGDEFIHRVTMHWLLSNHVVITTVLLMWTE